MGHGPHGPGFCFAEEKGLTLVDEAVSANIYHSCNLMRKYLKRTLVYEKNSDGGRVDKFIVKSKITFNKLKEVETVSIMESTKITPHPEDYSQCSGKASVSEHKPRQRIISYQPTVNHLEESPIYLEQI